MTRPRQYPPVPWVDPNHVFTQAPSLYSSSETLTRPFSAAYPVAES